MWAMGMALGIILMDITPGYNPDIMSFLFGSIIAVTHFDIYIMFFWIYLLFHLLYYLIELFCFYLLIMNMHLQGE